MPQPHLQDAASNDRFAQSLIELSGSSQFDQMLRNQQASINASVIRRLKDEVSHLVRVDVSRALKLAEVTREAAAFCQDLTGMALAHHTVAQVMLVSGHYAEALDAYEQADAIYADLGQELESARIGRAKVGVLMYLGRYEEALSMAAEARTIFQKHDQPILLAQLETNVGAIFHRLDRYQEALNYHARAREIFSAHQDERALASACFNCANQYTNLNKFERALALYQESGEIFKKLDEPLAVNEVEYSIAWLYFLRGNFQASLKLFAAVRTRAQELGDSTLEALCALDLAEVYLRLNTYQDAIASAQSAAESFKSLKMSYEYTKAKMYLGMASIHLNELLMAERELQEARCGFLAEGNQVFTALTDLYLSDLFRRQRNWDQALEVCAEAQDIFAQHDLPAKAAYAKLQLAQLKLSLGEVTQARQLCHSATEEVKELEAPWLKYQVFHLLGNTLEQTGEKAEAYQRYVQSVHCLESLRSSIQVDEFKCTFLRDKLRLYEDLIGLCLQAGGEEKIEEALSYVEAAKSRALADLLASDQQIETKAPAPAAEAIRREWRELREQLNWFYNRISHYEMRMKGRPSRLMVKLRQEAHKREQILAKLARQMDIEDSEYSSLQTAPPADIEALRQALAEDEVVVEYYIVKGQLKVFLISFDSVRVFDDLCKVGEIAPLLRQLKFYFDKFTLSGNYVNAHQGNVQTLVDQCLMLLHKKLVEPLASLLVGKKMIIVPHDILHYVPFHALHDGQKYLIDRHEISFSPSASVFKLCLEKVKRRSTDGQVLILGAPDGATPYIHEETAVVKSLWPEAQVFLGKAATLDQLKRSAPHCRLLHLASHGVFRRDNPMFSALKLSDSWLNFYDIFNLNLTADLVTLSACETGMNEIFPGDELFGLMRGFLYAGAPSLIVSLWVVHDRSTAEFMRWLYTGLSQGLSKRAAMRQAQLSVKQKYPHPYYWAPFILMGAPV